MTHPGELWLFAGVMVLGQFSPGPDMLLLTRTALRHGSATGVKMALGIACGLMVHSTLAIAGMAIVFERFATLRRVLEWLAALYLLWISYNLLREAFSTWRNGAKPTGQDGGQLQSPFVRGLMCNLLNPKVALFLAAICTPFLAGDHPAWWPAALWLTVVGLGAGLWSLWVVLLQWNPLRRLYERAAVWTDTLFGLALILLAAALIRHG